MAGSAPFAASVVTDTRRSPNAKLAPVPIADSRIDDEFWSPRVRMTREVTLPSQYEQCERTGRIDNFRRAAGSKQVGFQGRYYNDSDVYKWVEAASYALATAPDPALAQRVDDLVDLITAAQQPDGYLNTYFTFERAGDRFSDLLRMHELYCAGHLIQAAVAHHRATGKRTLLDVGIRLADLICRAFGPDARHATDGHEEIELALVELYRETGERTYLDRAAFFLDQRGQRPPVLDGRDYVQDHLPVREQTEIRGHAVRATYLACGMADVYAETGDATLRQALEGLWRSAFTRKTYITGGLGARYVGEAFGEDYELPNERAYAETCAAIGGFMWNWRMLLLSGEARFADWMEIALYNGILSGLSLSGDAYFYVNPLADRGSQRRQPWFDTACCPPNIARLLMSLPGYLYAVSPRGLWVHLYAAGSVRATLPDGETMQFTVKTRYPLDGTVRLTVETAPPAETSLFVRIPGWSNGAGLSVNGQPAAVTAHPSTYAELRHAWRPGDVVELTLPLPVRRVVSHPRVSTNSGQVALCRGPLAYCVEGVDHPGVDVADLILPANASLTVRARPDLIGGIVVVNSTARAMDTADWNGRLYGHRDDGGSAPARPVPLTAIPYYAWANRDAGPMRVWLRER